MKLQDYLHYYIGCDYWTNNSQGNLNAKTLPDVIDMCKRDKGVQLHLRRLTDLTEDEWNEVEDTTSICEIGKGIGAFKFAFLDGGSKDRYHWTITNQALIELRKRGVDVDGLIDAGLAVDAKTLQS